MAEAHRAVPDVLPEPPDWDVPLRATLSTGDLDEARAFCRRLFYAPLRVRPVGDPADLAFSADVVRLGPVTVGRIRYGTGIRLDTTDLQSGYHVLAPLTGSLSAWHRGTRVRADPGRAAVFSPAGDIGVLWPGDCALLSVKVDRYALEDELAAVHPERVTSSLGTSFTTASGPGRTWAALTRLLHAELREPDALVQQPVMARTWSRLIVSGLAETVEVAGADERVRSPCRPRPVKRVIDAMHADPGRQFTAADLASIAGVGVRVLQESFRQHVGMSPLTYLRRLRLDGVHAELSRSDPWQVAVGEVAYRWGFTHLGRFAGAYRARFGRSPSQTLRERS